jgi:hypothetical protein
MGETPASNRRPQARTSACLTRACVSELVDDGSGREFVFYKLRASNLWDTNQGGSLSFTNYDPKFVERRVVPQTR